MEYKLPEVFCVAEANSIKCRPAINPEYMGSDLQEQIESGTCSWVSTIVGTAESFPRFSAAESVRSAAEHLMKMAACTAVLHVRAEDCDFLYLDATLKLFSRSNNSGSVVIGSNEAGVPVWACVLSKVNGLMLIAGSIQLDVPKIPAGMSDCQIVEGYGIPIASIIRVREEIFNRFVDATGNRKPAADSLATTEGVPS